MDLKGAFTLLDFDPASVPLLATELDDELVVFFLAGIFGWTAMPMVFQVITRTIVWELQQPGVLCGSFDMFVDDMFGVTFQKDLVQDMETVQRFCTDLLGDEATAVDKTDSGVRLTLIGWDIDLHQQLVTISRPNALSAFYGYA